jgi:hypothetical protein
VTCRMSFPNQGASHVVGSCIFTQFSRCRIFSTDAKLATREASSAFPFSADASDGRPMTSVSVYSPIPVVRRCYRLPAAHSELDGVRRSDH